MFTYRTSSVARERESEQDISSLISILNMLPDTKPSVWQPGISVVSCFTVKWLRVMELPLKPLPYKTGHLLRRQIVGEQQSSITPHTTDLCSFLLTHIQRKSRLAFTFINAACEEAG
ncbi:uncharacterized [Tachysurus ichikawai]